MFRPIRTREDLLAYLTRHAPTTACATAIKEKRVCILGGFTPAGGLPCWIVRITSKHHRDWYMKVECDEGKRAYFASILSEDSIPWADWIGERRGRRPLIDGDMPKLASLYRVMAWRKLR